MRSAKTDAFIDRSVDPSAVQVVGNYTVPPTYGVYRISATKGRGREYRFGNHPIRQYELVREYGAAHLEALFTDRSDAVELATLRNKA